MPAGDRQRTWFPEMVKELRVAWRTDLSWHALIALRDRLDGMLQHLRAARHIKPAITAELCPRCQVPMIQSWSRVSVRATILALARFGIAPEAEVRALEKRWKQYRQATGCDLHGKPTATGGEA